jgi:SAM-dependent methyltransferase
VLAQALVVLGLLAIGVVIGGYAVFRWDAARYRRRHQQASKPSSMAGEESGSPGLHVNHNYLLHVAAAAAGGRQDFKILDFGCGAGEIVAEGRARGLSMYGTDLYTEAASPYRERARQRGLLGDAIREIQDGRTGFPDAYFDFAISNQVFEHVENLEESLAELARVLKPGATIVCMFPSLEVIREGHIGIPLAHWFPKRSRSGRTWVKACRLAGLGYVKDPSVQPDAWAANAVNWVDENTFYRPRRALARAFGRYFSVHFQEEDNVAFRLRQRGRATSAGLVARAPLASFARVAFRRSAGVVLAGIRK